ncbi:hypothetical protein BTR23_16430 [Alkalihalophilus pseudofirmus]|nr:hypothetical protein BTR23_16430 [Alkalihalophilus pseudofirmus]
MYLKEKGLTVLDMREKGGKLWVNGGLELTELFNELKKRALNLHIRRMEAEQQVTNPHGI